MKHLMLVLALFCLAACSDNGGPTTPAPDNVATAEQPAPGTPAEQVPPESHFPDDEQIRAIFQQRIDEGRGVGYVLGLIDADGSTRVVSAGDPGPGAQPLNGDSIFEIGSISKTFTATLLADMVVRGEVRLDQPIEELLPDGISVPQRNGRQITLLDIATHTSGLPRLPDNMPFSDMSNPYSDYSDELMLEFVNRHVLTRDIGSQYEYSNLAVGLLAYALGRVHGGGYGAILRERILNPLRMNHSDITLTPEMQAQATRGHNEAGNVTSYWDFASMPGTGDIRSSVNDMMKYLAANMNPGSTGLSDAIRLAQQVHYDSGQGLRLGLNWHFANLAGKDVLWHNGGTGGYRTFLGFIPEDGLGLVLLTNSAHSGDDIAMHLFNPASPLQAAHVDPEEVAVDEAILARYVGVYQATPQIQVEITRQEGQLFAQATGEGQSEIFAASETEFFWKGVPARIEFQTSESAEAEVTGMLLKMGGGATPAKKIR